MGLDQAQAAMASPAAGRFAGIAAVEGQLSLLQHQLQLPGARAQAEGALQAEGTKAQGQPLLGCDLGRQHQETGRGKDRLVADGMVGQVGLLAGIQGDLVVDPP